MTTKKMYTKTKFPIQYNYKVYRLFELDPAPLLADFPDALLLFFATGFKLSLSSLFQPSNEATLLYFFSLLGQSLPPKTEHPRISPHVTEVKPVSSPDWD